MNILKFAIGFGCLQSLLVVVDLVLPGGFDATHRDEVVWLALVLVIAPVAISTAVAAIVHQLRPMRIFMSSTTGAFGPARFGFLVALVSAALVPFALVLFSKWDVEAFIPVSISAVVTLVAARFIARRYMPGHCFRCGYDIHRSLDANRCPECGNALMGSCISTAAG